MNKPNALILRLEKALQQYDKILLFVDVDKLRLFLKYCVSTMDENIGKSILVISSFSLDKAQCRLPFDYNQISVQEIAQLKKLYFMYEFSERFQIIDKNDGFGDLSNYVDVGLLSDKELYLTMFS